MTCTPIDLGGGVTGFVCSRGRRQQAAPCSACRYRPHDLVCDHPLSGKATGRTCSAKLCRRCASHVDGRDLCPPHAKANAAQASLDAWRDRIADRGDGEMRQQLRERDRWSDDGGSSS